MIFGCTAELALAAAAAPPPPLLSQKASRNVRVRRRNGEALSRYQPSADPHRAHAAIASSLTSSRSWQPVHTCKSSQAAFQQRQRGACAGISWLHTSHTQSGSSNAVSAPRPFCSKFVRLPEPSTVMRSNAARRTDPTRRSTCRHAAGAHACRIRMPCCGPRRRARASTLSRARRAGHAAL